MMRVLWNVLALPVNFLRCGASWRERRRLLRASFRLNRAFGEALAVEVLNWSRDLVRSFNLGPESFRDLVLLAADLAHKGHDWCAILNHLEYQAEAWAMECTTDTERTEARPCRSE